MQAQITGNSVAKVSPVPIQVVLLQLGKDIDNIVRQQPTTPGVSRLAVKAFIILRSQH